MAQWKAVIGLEVHAQLATRSKLFCGCEVVSDGRPNRAICPVCMGHPGALPQLNGAAVDLALRAGLAFGMRVHARSAFDRKHYQYPDLPKGYQITQQRWPICTSGHLHLREGEQLVPFAIERLQLEEDSARLQHAEGRTLVDFNRAGVPLIELVGAPDLSTPAQAEAWLRMLHRVLVEARICGGAMEKGQLRCDANLSVCAPDGSQSPRVELKNLNSFRHVRKALEFEIQRLQAAMEAGEPLSPETRSWEGGSTRPLREKAHHSGYRFAPDPDLGNLLIDEDMLQQAARALPGMPPLDIHLLRADDDRVAGWMQRFGLEREQALQLSGNPELAGFFSACVEKGLSPQQTMRWLQRDIPARLKELGRGLEETPLRPSHLSDLQDMLEAQEITRAVAESVLAWILRQGGDARGLVAVQGLGRVRDPDLIQQHAEAILAAHPEQVAAWRGGKTQLLGFFLGQARQATRGRVDPHELEAAVLAALESES
ncbi:MAG: Asp-tRNA(Asn)/Glu-tRNA(Gln) amidotransferase subunit GatB [Myxococcota bacterium]|nr:Asp-tRNA(Asn)/Glu-tRNA(Gln) amidotransferase subunit GatB [Myxococcota bacterium]